MLGQIEPRGDQYCLGCGLYRAITQQKTEGSVPLPLLTKIAQVKSLTQEQAQKGYPVKIRGIITAPIYNGCFIQDGTWAIYVRWEGLVLSDTPRTGDYCGG